MVQPVLKNTYCTSVLHMYCPNNSLILYVNGGKNTFYTKGCIKTHLFDRVIKYSNKLRGKRRYASLK